MKKIVVGIFVKNYGWWLRVTLFSCLIFFFLVGKIEAAPLLDQTSSGNNGIGATSVSVVVSTSGGNRALIATVSYNPGVSGANNAVVSGGGLSWQRVLGRSSGGSTVSVEVWLATSSVSIVSQTVTAAFSANRQAVLIVSSYSGADLSQPIGATCSNIGTASGSDSANCTLAILYDQSLPLGSIAVRNVVAPSEGTNYLINGTSVTTDTKADNNVVGADERRVNILPFISSTLVSFTQNRNNTRWAMIGLELKSTPFFITGTIYADEGVNIATSTVKVAVSGNVVSSTFTNGIGVYTLSMREPPSSTVITAWMDNGGGGNGLGATVTRYSGSGDITGFNIYKNRLIIRHEDLGPTTNSNIGICDKTTGSACTDTDLHFNESGGTLTVDNDWELHVWTGDTFTPGGTVTLSTGGVSPGGDLHVVGTLSGTNDINVYGGDVTGSGIINLTGGTTTVSSTGTFGDSGIWVFNRLTFGGGTATVSGTVTSTIASVLTINSGATLNAGSKKLLLNGTSTPFVKNGTFTAQSSTVTFAGVLSAGFNIPNSTWYNLKFDAVTTTIAYQCAGTNTVNGSLDILSGYLGMTTSCSMTINGTTTVGTAIGNTAATLGVWNSVTINATYNGNVIINTSTAACAYSDDMRNTTNLAGNLTINGGTWCGRGVTDTAGNFTFTGNNKIITDSNIIKTNLGRINIGGSSIKLGSSIKATWVTINSGKIFDLNGSNTLTLTGTGTPFITTGIFIPSTGEIEYTGSGSVTLNPTTYYGLRVNNNVGTFTFSTNTTTTNSLVVVTGTLVAPAGTLSLGGVFASTPAGFNSNNGTVIFNGGASQVIPSLTYNNIIVKGGSGVTHNIGAGTLAVLGDLTLGDGISTITLDASLNPTTITVLRDMIIRPGATFMAHAGTSNNISVGRDYINNGTFIANGGSVTFNGIVPQSIQGLLSGTSAFNELVIANNSGSDPELDPSVIIVDLLHANSAVIKTPSVKLRFPISATTTFTNIDWDGQATSTRLVLRSSNPGMPWSLAINGAQTVRNVDAKDSNACFGNNINATDFSNFDSGGNFCWNFSTIGFVATGSITSHIIDTEIQGGVAPNSIMWKGKKPLYTTVKFQIAASDNPGGPWNYMGWNGTSCDPNSYYESEGPGRWVEIRATCHHNKRYLRYKAVLQTINPTKTPVVEDIVLNFAR